MDAEDLGRKLLLTLSWGRPENPEKQTVGTVTASHKMLTLQALSSSLNAGAAIRKILVSIKFLPAILGPDMAAPILWAPGKIAFFLQENLLALQSPWPGTGVLTGKSLEVLWEVLLGVLWEIGVLSGVLSRVLRETGGAPRSAPEGCPIWGVQQEDHSQEHSLEHPQFP